MSAELIYKTSSPAAEAWWRNAEAKRAEQTKLRNDFEAEMFATYGLPDKTLYGRAEGRRALYVNRSHVIGLDSGWNERPPEGSGWRLDSKNKFWMPALKTPQGRALKKRLDALTVYVEQSHVDEIGIPAFAFGDSYLYRAGLVADEDPFVLYQVWGSGTCEKDCRAVQAAHPDVEWVEVPRSQWYARIEAKEQVSA